MDTGVLRCARCGGRGFVYKSRGVKRYRRCADCGYTWATVELARHVWLRVAMLLDDLYDALVDEEADHERETARIE